MVWRHDMKLKYSAIAIVLVLTMVTAVFAVMPAAAITVDGDPSDWDPGDKLCDDPDEVGANIQGYDMESLWGVIESSTLYARIDVYGVAGDADDDGSNTDSDTFEKPGVGEGAPCDYEQYYVEIDADNDGDMDYILKYCSGTSVLLAGDGITPIPGATTDAAHISTPGTPNNTVELSVVIDGTYCDINPNDYCLRGWADTQLDGAEDYTSEVCLTKLPPTPVPILSPFGAMLLVGIIAVLGAAAIVLRRRD